MAEIRNTIGFFSSMFEDSRRGSFADFAKAFASKLAYSTGADNVHVKLAGSRETLTSSEEFAANSMKQMIDNNLSEYSSFKDMVGFNVEGYKSCGVFPCIANGKAIAVVTSLSRQPDFFDNAITQFVGEASGVFAYMVSAKQENDRSISLAKYFDAAFGNSIPQAIIDENGTLVKVNKKFANMFDSGSRELTGKNIKTLFDIDANMLSIMTKGFVAEAQILPERNRIFSMSSSRITEKLMHIAANETTSEKLSMNISDAVSHLQHEAMLIIGEDDIIRWAGGNLESLLKNGSEALVGGKMHSMIEQKEQFDALLNGSAQSAGITLLLPNSMKSKVMATCFKIKGTGYGCILSSSAIEEYVRSFTKSTQDIINNTKDSVFIIDQLGYIKTINKGTERTFGYTARDIQGSYLPSLYNGSEYPDKINNAMRIAAKEGRILGVYAEMRAKDGTSIPSEQSVICLKNVDDEVESYLVLVNELLTKRNMEELGEALYDAEKREEKSRTESDLKTQFIYNISHDLKTPITNIKGFSKILYGEEFGKLNDDQKSYIKIISDEADRLMLLIQQILDVAKLSSGKIKLDLQQISFSKIEDNPSLRALEEVALNKGLYLKWDIAHDVPEVLMDPNRVIQIFVNLIGNAMKFTEKGGIDVRVFRSGKANIRVEVHDTGIGISKEDQRKLFKKFYQVPKKALTPQQGSGTGLGLSIAKEIISLHGGRIGVYSEPGNGSTFWFALPINGKKIKKQKQGQQPEEQHST